MLRSVSIQRLPNDFFVCTWNSNYQ